MARVGGAAGPHHPLPEVWRFRRLRCGVHRERLGSGKGSFILAWDRQPLRELLGADPTACGHAAAVGGVGMRI